jgi:hypothetical protein
MRTFIAVFATEVKETNTLVIHAIPNKNFANKEEAAQHYHMMPWGSISDYRKAKQTMNIVFNDLTK